MKKITLFIIAFLLLLSTFAFAGNGVYVTINNNTDYNISIKNIGMLHWYANMFSGTQQMKPESYHRFYSELPLTNHSVT